jgi:tripartite-type tricarboxylate transporter receptor subunit TctC
VSVHLNRRTMVAALASSGLLGLGASPNALAADGLYPTRPIRLIAGFVPGSAVDTVARLVGNQLAEELKQSVIIDNRPGAGGNIGALQVAKAAPDGYTLGMGVFGVHVINPHLFKNLPFDVNKDFTPIGCLATAIQVLVVNPKVPVHTVQELITYAKAHPGELTFSTPGNGSTGQLAESMLETMTGIKMTMVPFNGAAPARTSLLAGDIQVTFELVTTIAPHLKSGALRALAVTGNQRSPVLPDVPTMIESGLKDFEVTTWIALVGPAGLPAPIVAKLNQTVNEILARPATIKALQDVGTSAAPGSPEDLRQRMLRDQARWGPIIEKSGAKLD